MASSIDATKPAAGNATTLSVRENFASAKSEIESIQSDMLSKASWIIVNGVPMLVDPLTGLPVPIGGDSVLSSTVLILGSTTVVNSGDVVPFDEASRNDLNLDFTTSGAGVGVITLPVGMTQFRFGYHLKFNGASTGLPGGASSGNRRAVSNIVSGGVPEIEILLGIHDMTLQYPGIAAGDQALVWTTTDLNAGVLHYESPWVDVASLATAPSGSTGDDLLYITMVHNAGVDALSCLLGSSLWLETMSPA